jgi:hypothetical protein
MPQSLYFRGKNSRYPLDRKVCGPRFGMDTVAKRKYPAPTGLQTSAIQPIYLVTTSVLTELSWSMRSRGNNSNTRSLGKVSVCCIKLTISKKNVR